MNANVSIHAQHVNADETVSETLNVYVIPNDDVITI